MKITANAGKLSRALALAAVLVNDARAIKRIAALGAVHLVTAPSMITITANVLDHAISLSVPATIERPGAVAVASAQLSALVAEFSDKATVEIESDGNVARIGCGLSRFKLATIPSGDLPPMPKLTEEIGRVDLAREEVFRLLVPSFAVSTERTRYYMSGVLLHDSDHGLTAVATDGHRLTRTIVPGAAGLSQDLRLVIPAPAIEMVGKILRDRSIERVTLRRSRTLLAVEAATAVFVSKLIDATFPNYELVLPEPSGNSVVVDRAELTQALARLVAVAQDGQRRVAGLRWNAGEPVLRLCLPDSDAADDIIAAEAAGSGAIAVQIGLLTELLGALGGKHVHFDSRSGADPILMTDPDNAHVTALLVPCRWRRAEAA